MQKIRNSFVFDESLNASFLEELFEGDTKYAETVFEDFLKDLPVYWERVEAAYNTKNLHTGNNRSHLQDLIWLCWLYRPSGTLPAVREQMLH
jgi:hypothetical protein